jgi:hypothetical protein
MSSEMSSAPPATTSSAAPMAGTIGAGAIGDAGSDNATSDSETNDGRPAVLSLTWWLTRTYHHEVPLAAVAEATGSTVEEIAANPASLNGVVGQRLADLLTSHPLPEGAVGGAEVEIADATYSASPTLADLANAAGAAVRAESETGQPSPAGRALAALLAGLHREGITDR